MSVAGYRVHSRNRPFTVEEMNTLQGRPGVEKVSSDPTVPRGGEEKHHIIVYAVDQAAVAAAVESTGRAYKDGIAT